MYRYNVSIWSSSLLLGEIWWCLDLFEVVNICQLQRLKTKSVYLLLAWYALVLQFTVAVLVCKCLHETAPSYLVDELEYTANFEAQRRLRSASIAYGCPPSAIGFFCPYSEQSVPPCHVRTSISVFWGRLKAFLFRHSFPWLLPQLLWCLSSDSRHFRTLKSFFIYWVTR